MTKVIIAHYRCAPGSEEGVARALRSMTTASRAEPGNLEYRVCRSAEDRTKFAIYEEYVDSDAFEAHLSSPHFATWLAGGVLPHLTERRRHDLEPL